MTLSIYFRRYLKLSFYDEIITYITTINSDPTTGQIHHLSRILKIVYFIKNKMIENYDEIIEVENKTNNNFRLKHLYRVLVEADDQIFQFYRIEMSNDEYHIIGVNCKFIIIKGMLIFMNITEDRTLIQFIEGLYGYNWRSIGLPKYRLVQDFMKTVYEKYALKYDIIIDTNSVLSLF